MKLRLKRKAPICRIHFKVSNQFDMYKVRMLTENDNDKLYRLYRNVAAQKRGLARSITEIDKKYINALAHRSVTNGISFVIDHHNNTEIIAEIHCNGIGPKQFDHVLSNVTILVNQHYQGKGLGKLIFKHLLTHIEEERTDILRLELFTRESNTKAISFYQKLGFKIEGKFKNRVLTEESYLESDIAMAWFNRNYIKGQNL